jgi:hypothetical protein
MSETAYEDFSERRGADVDVSSIDSRASVLTAFKMEASPRGLRSALDRIELALQSALQGPARRAVRVAFGEFTAEWVQRGMARESMVVEVALLSDRVRLEISASGADPGPEFWDQLCEPAESRLFTAFRNRRGRPGVFIEVPSRAAGK